MSNKEERMNRNKSIIEDYKNGKPILEIAREYNLSETMCYKILKGTQEPPRYFEKKRKRLTTRNEQIVKQYKGGMTARELGKMYGISMQRIRRSRRKKTSLLTMMGTRFLSRLSVVSWIRMQPKVLLLVAMT